MSQTRMHAVLWDLPRLFSGRADEELRNAVVTAASGSFIFGSDFFVIRTGAASGGQRTTMDDRPYGRRTFMNQHPTGITSSIETPTKDHSRPFEVVPA